MGPLVSLWRRCMPVMGHGAFGSASQTVNLSLIPYSAQQVQGFGVAHEPPAGRKPSGHAPGIRVPPLLDVSLVVHCPFRHCIEPTFSGRTLEAKPGRPFPKVGACYVRAPGSLDEFGIRGIASGGRWVRRSHT